jgi:hypothetical protein
MLHVLDSYREERCRQMFRYIVKTIDSIEDRMGAFRSWIFITKVWEQEVQFRIEKRSDETDDDNLKKTASVRSRMLRIVANEKKSIEFFKKHRVKLESKHAECQKILDDRVVLKEKSVAFAMGHHKRLGVDSLMARLDPEVMRMVLELV